MMAGAWSQVTKIMGKVIDNSTQEPVPFANVYFKGTTIGVTTDFNGEFSIETSQATDTLVASFMGYQPQMRKITKFRFQQVTFTLWPSNIDLPEVVIVAGENPAEIILRKIIQNKDKNRSKEFEAYQYEAYTKIEIDANNITDDFKERRIYDLLSLSLIMLILPPSMVKLISPFSCRSHFPIFTFARILMQKKK